MDYMRVLTSGLAYSGRTLIYFEKKDRLSWMVKMVKGKLSRRFQKQQEFTTIPPKRKKQNLFVKNQGC